MKTKKWLKRNETHIDFTFGYSFLIGGVVFAVFAIYVFSMGFHNIDLSYNFALLSNDLNTYAHYHGNTDFIQDYRDTLDEFTVDGNTMSLTKFYILGISQIHMGFWLFGISVFAASTGLASMFSAFNREKWKNER